MESKVDKGKVRDALIDLLRASARMFVGEQNPDRVTLPIELRDSFAGDAFLERIDFILYPTRGYLFVETVFDSHIVESKSRFAGPISSSKFGQFAEAYSNLVIAISDADTPQNEITAQMHSTCTGVMERLKTMPPERIDDVCIEFGVCTSAPTQNAPTTRTLQ